MKKLIAKDLKIKFIETLNELDGFTYEEGNPFLIKLGLAKYFIFLKNLSPAYFKNSPDVTRVQLPYSEHFLKISKTDIPFIILGYDVDTDIVVSWNPKKVKERVNAKSNVSLYSRYSLQKQVRDDEFRFGYLSNGEKIILFKRQNLIYFFETVSELFKEDYAGESISVAKIQLPLSNKDLFAMWLQEKGYSDKTVKHYTSGLNKISRDLIGKFMLNVKSLFEIKDPKVLYELYQKWYSVMEFRENDIIGKLMYSNSFKRFIEFCEYKQKNIPESLYKTTKHQTEIQLKSLNSISKITDQELLQSIICLLKKNQVLQAVEITSKKLGGVYKDMTFKDWYKIIGDFYRNINNSVK